MGCDQRFADSGSDARPQARPSGHQRPRFQAGAGHQGLEAGWVRAGLPPQYNGLWNSTDTCLTRPFNSHRPLYSPTPQYNGLWNSTDTCLTRPFNSPCPLYSPTPQYNGLWNLTDICLTRPPNSPCPLYSLLPCCATCQSAHRLYSRGQTI
jgi:hypothetical protein